MAWGGQTSRAICISLCAILQGAILSRLHAQTPTATLSGTVSDISGAVVADAKLTLTNSNTGFSRTTDTDDKGRYSLTNIEPGTYEVRVEHHGFKITIQKGVVLAVGGAAALQITMEIGPIREITTVSSIEPLIETTSSSLSPKSTNRPSNHCPSWGATL